MYPLRSGANRLSGTLRSTRFIHAPIILHTASRRTLMCRWPPQGFESDLSFIWRALCLLSYEGTHRHRGIVSDAAETWDYMAG